MSTALPPPVLRGPARALFEPFTMAVLATTNADTSPQVSMIAAQLDGDEIVLVHQAWYQKLRNIRRNPRVALTVIPPVGPDAGGPQPYLVVHGIARVQQGDAGPWQERLLDAMAAGAPPGTPSARPGPPPGGGWTTHITPVRLGGVGPWLAPPATS